MIITYGVIQLNKSDANNKRAAIPTGAGSDYLNFIDKGTIPHLNFSCSAEGLEGDSQCGFGRCVRQEDNVLICVCDPGYTTWWVSSTERVDTGTQNWPSPCGYEQRPQLNAFLASFFGGSVGADWFYLHRGGLNGGYVAAGVYKLVTLCGVTLWCTVDWIRVLVSNFPDGNTVPLHKNLV